MDRIEAFRRSFAYDHWANTAFADALASLRDPPARCASWLAHVVGTEVVWLARLQERPSALAVWPVLTPTQITRHLEDLRITWPRFLDTLPRQSLAHHIGYVNSKGERWQSRVDDVLEHVLLHGAYHRGQIASALRAAGHEPPYTDYIQATRSGAI